MNARPPHATILLVGTHRRAHHSDTEDTAFGIYTYALEGAGGGLTALELTESLQPGWIAVHPVKAVAYAANEVRDEAHSGISAFSLDAPSGALKLLNRRPLPAMPCHCAVDATGCFLFAATFGGGSVHLFALESDGSIGRELDTHHHVGSSTHPRRQTSPHAHAVTLDPTNRFLLVPDLGTDQLYVYAFDRERGKLTPGAGVKLPAQSGPRHVAFAPDGCFVYLLNEMSATILVFAFDPVDGGLTPMQEVELLPEGFGGARSGAAILIHPRGLTLYATTRSHGSSGMPPEPGLDSLVWWQICPQDGTLQFGGRVATGGSIARDMTFEPGAAAIIVAHQCSGTLVRFALDPISAAPESRGVVARTPVPVCVAIVETIV